MESRIIFVTGATGFIGANLVRRLLKHGHEVHVSVRKESSLWRIKEIETELNFHYSDNRDYSSIEKTILEVKPEIIYHLAIYGGYPFQTDSNKIIETNVNGTINLLNACLKTDFQCFVNTGTSSEYGMKPSAINETDLLEPVTPYAFSKACATLYCHMIAKSRDKPVVTLRPFSAYGYYEEPGRLMPTVINSYLKNEQPKLSSKSPVRDFVFIEDLVDAHVLAAGTAHAHGEIINIGCGRQYTVGEVVEKIKNITGSRLEPVWGVVGSRANEPKMWVADITKAKNILGWKPEHNLDDGLKKTVKWFENNQSLY